MVNLTPPHIRQEGSVPARMWTTAAALLPVSFVFTIFFGFDGFRLLTVAVTAAVLSELLIEKLLKKKVKIGDGSAVITGIMLALWLPPTLPSWGVALGAFVALFLGREIFGGLGNYPFHPALVGFFFLSLEPFEAFFWDPPQGLHLPAASAILLGGLFLLFRRSFYWEIPLLYLGALFIFSAGRAPLFSTFPFLAAFFLVTDPVTTPVSRTGERWFALGSGALTAAVLHWFPHGAAVAASLLLANALTPGIDISCRGPRRKR